MKFKDRQDYLDQRNVLMDKTQNAINEGNAEEAEKAMADVQALDDAYAAFANKQAELQALNDKLKVTNQLPLAGEKANMNEDLGKEDVTDKSSAAYKNAWIRAMKGEKLSDKEQNIIDMVNRENVETVAGGHTLIVPTTVKNGIWEAAAELHPVIQDLVATFIQGDVTIIKDTSAESEADWTDEQTASADAEFAEGSVNLTGCELCKSVSISWKLKKMNNQDYEAYLIKKLGMKIGNTIAKSLFHGKGKPASGDSFKPQAKGVVTALKAQKNTPQVISYTSDIKYTDLTALMAKVKSAYKNGASFYANNTTIWNKLANIVDGQKRPIFIPDVTAGGVGRIFGIPVKEEDGVNDGEVVLGNYGVGYAFNFNESMSVYQEDHVKERKTDYMAYGIADGDVITEDAFALLETASAS